MSIDFIATPPPVTDCVVLILGRGKEGCSVTITDEFRIASGYGSVWVVAAGIEPASIGALPIAIRAAVSYMTSIFTVAYLLARH
ncbi:hypothetical protein EW406_22435 [Salmonella enterica subsp. enterica serovar Havana]|nr:hypothetical protein [Salmonella enterica subsp. enterica serovar Havana]ECE9412019.1 hypothetical protein [Salmonella enterica subsp. enterica serovar Havana]ECG5594661.1 hypothetical protein [Salmonella enterica subsp. enterica serovar Havana]ECG8362022.1 hypothetical protein [Salmonella enterica subsp. enterica serovar Havana]ECP5744359.1 hypothetical protein [Salmonella enterica]